MKIGKSLSYSWSSFKLKPGTSTAGEHSTDAELEAAIQDCRVCISVEYPETEPGCGTAIPLLEKLVEIMKKRRKVIVDKDAILRARGTLTTQVDCPNIDCREIFYLEGKWDDEETDCPACGQTMTVCLI